MKEICSPIEDLRTVLWVDQNQGEKNQGAAAEYTYLACKNYILVIIKDDDEYFAFSLLRCPQAAKNHLLPI